MTADHTTSPPAVGQLPSVIYALVQQGRNGEGAAYTHIEMTTKKDQFDAAVAKILEYGTEKTKYRAVYGTVTWQSEEPIIPDVQDKQLGMFALPPKGRPGPVPKQTRKAPAA